METHETKQAKTPFMDMFLRSIAVLGIIAVLVLGAWGIIQLAVAIPGFFANLGSGTPPSLVTNTNAQKETLAVSGPASVASGQTVQLAWNHQNSDTSVQYSYAISYACQNGLTLKAPVPTGAYQGVACNTPFNYVSATQHMIVIPTLSGNSSVPVVFTITSIKLSTGTVTATGSATVTVTPAAAATAKPVATTKVVAAKSAVAGTKPNAAYYPASIRAALYGYSDLAVGIISVTPNGTRTTVEFVITNIGTNIVHSGWTFNATLPINGGYTFASQRQQALYPGDKIVYTMSFDNTFASTQYQNGSSYTGPNVYNAGGYSCNGYNCTTSQYNTNYQYGNSYSLGTITITADPLNYIAEPNKGNNTASATTPVY